MLFVSLHGTVVRWLAFFKPVNLPSPHFPCFSSTTQCSRDCWDVLWYIMRSRIIFASALSATNSLLFRYYSRMILFIFVFSICTSRSIYLLRSFTSSSVLSPLQFPTSSSPDKNCIDLGFRLCVHMYTQLRDISIFNIEDCYFEQRALISPTNESGKMRLVRVAWQTIARTHARHSRYTVNRLEFYLRLIVLSG